MLKGFKDNSFFRDFFQKSFFSLLIFIVGSNLSFYFIQVLIFHKVLSLNFFLSILLFNIIRLFSILFFIKFLLFFYKKIILEKLIKNNRFNKIFNKVIDYIIKNPTTLLAYLIYIYSIYNYFIYRIFEIIIKNSFRLFFFQLSLNILFFVLFRNHLFIYLGFIIGTIINLDFTKFVIMFFFNHPERISYYK